VLCFTGPCILSLRSWAFNDNGLTFVGYIKGNGVTLVNYTRDSALYTGTNVELIGFNTAIIHPDTCTATQFLNFCTPVYPSAVDQMVAYLQSLQNGTIIAGVTIGNADPHLLTTNAKRALLAIGVDPYQIGPVTKVVFVATIGQPTFTKVNYAPASGNNLEMTAGVPCTYTHVLISRIVCFKSITIIQLNSV